MADTDVNVNFRANSTQLNKIMRQLKALQNKIRAVSKQMTQFNNTFKKIDSRFATTAKRTSLLNKRFHDQDQRMTRLRQSMSRLTGKTKEYNDTVKKGDTASKNANQRFGFTGLAFGFVGGMAAYAANQIRSTFIQALDESASLLSEINRVSLFSDQGIFGGQVDTSNFDKQFERSIEVADRFGLSLQEIPSLLKAVEKAAPSNINTKDLGDAIAGFKLLENEVDVSQLTSDFSTILANFPGEDIQKLADLTLGFSKATKLSFSAGSKTLAFAAQDAKRMNTTVEELMGIMTTIVAAVPGDRGTGGRSVRMFIRNLTKPENVTLLKKFGIEVFDLQHRFRGLESVLNDLSNTYNKFNKENQEKANAFISEIGLSANAATGILAYASATEEAKAAAKAQFKDVNGSFLAAVENQATTAESAMNRFKNFITQIKLEFGRGFFPVLTEINDLLSKMFEDTNAAETLRELGKVIGTELLGVAKAVVPILTAFFNLLKDNQPAIQALGKSMVYLFGALQAAAVILPLVGSYYAYLFIKMKLAGLQADKTAFSIRGLRLALERLTSIRFGSFSKAFGRLTARLTSYGVAAGARFGIAFNIISNFVIGAGAWIRALGIRLAETFAITGSTTGLAFAGAFTTAARVGIAALPVAVIIGSLFAGWEIGKILWEHVGKPINQWFQDYEVDAALEGKNPLQKFFDDISVFLTGSTMDELGTQLNEAWNNFWGNLGEINLYDLGVKVMVGAFGGIFGTIYNLKDEVYKQMKALWDGDYSPVGADVGNDIINGIINSFTGIAKIIYDAIIEPVTNYDNWKTIGDKIGQGISEGFKSWFGDSTHGIFDPRNWIPATEPQSPGNGFLDANPNIGPYGNGSPGFIGPQQPEYSPMQEALNLAVNNLSAYLDKYVQDERTPLGIKKETEKQLTESTENYNDAVDKSKISMDAFTGSTIATTKSTAVSTESKKLNTQIMDLFSATLNVDINEVIRNINQISQFTTMIAAANEAFAEIVGQGHRAAAKLASLWVDSDGNWHMLDPGVSESDKKNISKASANFASTQQHQVFLEPKVLVEINPVITLANSDNPELQKAAQTLVDELKDTIQTQLGSISG